MFEIGNTLREARLRRNLDIADCESATKIRAKYLRALEEEQFEVLPGGTYVKGFLRTYADYLELDGRLVIEEYDTRFGGRTEHYVGETEASRRRSRQRRNREARLLAILAGLVLVVATGIWAGFADESAASRPAPAAAEPPARAVTAVFALTGATPTTLEVRQESSTGEVLVAAGPLRARAPREVAARPPIWVSVADVQRVTVTIDGRSVSIPAGANQFRVLDGGVIDVSPSP